MVFKGYVTVSKEYGTLKEMRARTLGWILYVFYEVFLQGRKAFSPMENDLLIEESLSLFKAVFLC